MTTAQQAEFTAIEGQVSGFFPPFAPPTLTADPVHDMAQGPFPEAEDEENGVVFMYVVRVRDFYSNETLKSWLLLPDGTRL